MVYTHNRSVTKVFSFFLIASVSVVAMLVSAPVSSAILEEIIVTAQKRDENLQTVPLSVSAYSQDRLTRIGANNVERLGALTPGLEWGQFGMSTKVSIRGQSTASSEANTDGSVALFIDGIYLGRGQQMWSAMTDVERVEVLRGPQGTLFGRNASGGSINIITKKPSKEIEAKFEVTAGTYDHISTSGHFNLPLTDSLAARVSFLQEDHDGYLVNRFEPDQSQLDEDMWYVRGALRFEDGGPLTVDLAVDYYDQGGNGNGFSGVKFFDQLTPEINTWAAALGGPDTGNTTEDWVFEGNRSYRDTESVTVALTISYDLTENINVKSISGYSDFSQLAGGETDFSIAFLADCRLFTDAKLLSTELQLSSIGAETLEWLVGFYYLDEEIVERFVFEFMPGAFGGPLDPRAASLVNDPALVLDFSNRLGTAT
ncbi:MAG: TonB-dependent receptor plug domain-containing protein, partial [Proteobacteria bacterium]|nr:TonB-dependent receptor plug domain-containing protein [Pseudomonadota bacterium]